MKTKILIIGFLIVSLLSAFTLKSHAQQSKSILLNPVGAIITDTADIGLIADETWLTYSKTGAKIVTYNESVLAALTHKWEGEFKRWIITYEAHKGNRYRKYSIYLSTETGNNIRQWSKKNL